MRANILHSIVLSALLLALTGCQSRPKPTFLNYAQLDNAQRQALTNHYTPDAIKAREEEEQGRQRQWGDQFTVYAKREPDDPPPQFQYNNSLEEEAHRNRAQRKSKADSGCNCRVKPFKAVKRAFGL
ncbi:hypothetical protein VZ95_15500 [Elstera litoralis]|uniref:Lipoprotein n=1 Tax=Elstera litoralis TaxID=552518 RepID=A0A0F3IQA7_9PROT|nr:hypothetical protein [Elstera litoralis]KJV08797.1 hypothetical protein VZ95_15500 [Elstera litoralis]